MNESLIITIGIAGFTVIISIIGFFLKQSVFTEMEETNKRLDSLHHHVNENEKEVHKTIAILESSLSRNSERDNGDEKARNIELKSLEKRIENAEDNIRLIIQKDFK